MVFTRISEQLVIKIIKNEGNTVKSKALIFAIPFFCTR